MNANKRKAFQEQLFEQLKQKTFKQLAKLPNEEEIKAPKGAGKWRFLVYREHLTTTLLQLKVVMRLDQKFGLWSGFIREFQIASDGNIIEYLYEPDVCYADEGEEIEGSYSTLVVNVDNAMPALKIALKKHSDWFAEPLTTGTAVPVHLKSGNVIYVYAEVVPNHEDITDFKVCIIVTENDVEVCVVRSASTISVHYVTKTDEECVFRLGP
jgi:hypothetical protein